MTAWGKGGRPFADYGVAAAREALDDAGVAWTDVDLIVGGETVRNGYAGYVAGSSVAAALGFNGAKVATVYGACASGAMAIDHARAQIMAGLADVVLVVGAGTTPKGFLAPNAGERPDDPDRLRVRLVGGPDPAHFRPSARLSCAPPAAGGPPVVRRPASYPAPRRARVAQDGRPPVRLAAVSTVTP